MPLYVKMDQTSWVQGDFTDSATYDLSGTIYRDNRFATAETSLDTFTGELRLIDKNDGSPLYTTTSNLTLNSDGTFLIKFSESDTPHIHGNVKVRLRCTISGSRLTAIGVNGSDELYIEND
jgi:hypothetical protein